MANAQNLKPFKKGDDARRSANGRPVGSKSKLVQLRKLIKDIIHIHNGEVNDYTKKLIYQLYEVAMSDMSVQFVSDVVSDLYFMESDFGIKIGVSKNVNVRLKQLQSYAPSCEILKVVKNAGCFEKTLHKYFKSQNIRNNPTYGVEWFYKNDDLLEFIESINTPIDLVNKFGGKGIKQLTIEF
jgi:hypothetical protein